MDGNMKRSVVISVAALCLAVIFHPGRREPVEPPPPDDVAVLLAEHAAFDNELFVGGQELLVAESAFPADDLDE